MTPGYMLGQESHHVRNVQQAALLSWELFYSLAKRFSELVKMFEKERNGVARRGICLPKKQIQIALLIKRMNNIVCVSPQAEQ